MINIDDTYETGFVQIELICIGYMSHRHSSAAGAAQCDIIPDKGLSLLMSVNLKP
jgi:hypothetical protein